MLSKFPLSSAATVFVLSLQAAGRALDLLPIIGLLDVTSTTSSKRAPAKGLDLLPISDPTVITHGRSLKREEPGNGCFDPSSIKSFFWGVYSDDNIYVANFTLENPGDDEFILPVEDFAQTLKSIHCGSPASPYMNLEFYDKASFNYAKSAWNWVNKEDINKFTVVTEPNQCYEGDNRSPYLVRSIDFDDKSLRAKLHAEEKEWAEIAHSFKLHLGHQHVDPATANVTHPHLTRRADKVLDLTNDWDLRLFEFGENSDETSGLQLTADAQIKTGGQIITDFDIETKFFIPRDVKLTIKPQGLQALFLLKLEANGKLGKPLDYALQPEIEIPISALNIKGILEIGPFITMGVHFESSALEGTASVTTGARASIDDSAEVKVKLRKPDDNSISGWTPNFEKLETNITASIHGSLKAWAELAITIKAEAFGKWGYQASLEAQLPYFEAAFDASFGNTGVCGTEKTAGVELEANVGININLNAGEVNEAPKFEKELFETSWPLFSTCFAFGGNVRKQTDEVPTVPTKLPVGPPVADVPSEPTPEPVDSTTEMMEPSPTWNPDEPAPTAIQPSMSTTMVHPEPTTNGHATTSSPAGEQSDTSGEAQHVYTSSEAHPPPVSTTEEHARAYTSSKVHPPAAYTGESYSPSPIHTTEAQYTSAYSGETHAPPVKTTEVHPPQAVYTTEAYHPIEVYTSEVRPPAVNTTQQYQPASYTTEEHPPAVYTTENHPLPVYETSEVHPPPDVYTPVEVYTPPVYTPDVYAPPAYTAEAHPSSIHTSAEHPSPAYTPDDLETSVEVLLPEPIETHLPPVVYTSSEVHPRPPAYTPIEAHSPPAVYTSGIHPTPVPYEEHPAPVTSTVEHLPAKETPCTTTLMTATKRKHAAYYV